MEPLGLVWWHSFWPRIPLLLALLAGTFVCLFSFTKRRRRAASILGALSFFALAVLNLLPPLLNLLAERIGRGGRRAILTVGPLSLVLYLFDAVAVALLIAAVVLEEHPAEKSG